MTPCDPLRTYAPHDTDLKQKIICEIHDAPSSGHLSREKTFLRVSDKFWLPHLYRCVANYMRSCAECQRKKPAPSSSEPLKPCRYQLIVGSRSFCTSCLACRSTIKAGLGLVVFVDRLSKIVPLSPCSTKIADKEAALLFPDHVYRLYNMPKSIVSDRAPRFTLGF